MNLKKKIIHEPINNNTDKSGNIIHISTCRVWDSSNDDDGIINISNYMSYTLTTHSNTISSTIHIYRVYIQ